MTLCELSQSGLATVLGCSQSLIAMWERGCVALGPRYELAVIAFLRTAA